jgi:hypothetical protein
MSGDAELGDQRRPQRLVVMGAQMAARPGGHVTEVLAQAAAREATFGWLKSDEVVSGAIAVAIHRDAARASFGEPFAFVPEDGSSLNLRDATGAKKVGGRESAGQERARIACHVGHRGET